MTSQSTLLWGPPSCRVHPGCLNVTGRGAGSLLTHTRFGASPPCAFRAHDTRSVRQQASTRSSTALRRHSGTPASRAGPRHEARKEQGGKRHLRDAGRHSGSPHARLCAGRLAPAPRSFSPATKADMRRSGRASRLLDLAADPAHCHRRMALPVASCRPAYRLQGNRSGIADRACRRLPCGDLSAAYQRAVSFGGRSACTGAVCVSLAPAASRLVASSMSSSAFGSALHQAEPPAEACIAAGRRRGRARVRASW